MENVVFIILNVVFLAILVLFIFLKSGDVAILEENYAKQIALMVDAARPGMIITLDMMDAVEEADKEAWNHNDIINIQENIVTVKLRKEGSYSYSFFNDVEVYVDVFPKGRPNEGKAKIHIK